MKIKLNDMKRELHILKNSVANIDVLKCEVHSLGRQLLQERTKVKALSEELENPLNVHRCGLHESTLSLQKAFLFAPSVRCKLKGSGSLCSQRKSSK